VLKTDILSLKDIKHFVTSNIMSRRMNLIPGTGFKLTVCIKVFGARGGAVGWGIALQVGGVTGIFR
jgi:hypothetical protein